MKYLFASSLSSVAAQPSPTVAFPPLMTVPLSMLMSAPGPVTVAFWDVCAKRIGWPGSWDSMKPSWPEGTRSYVDWPDPGVGRALVVRLDGSAFSASKIIYWWGGHAFGASLV